MAQKLLDAESIDIQVNMNNGMWSCDFVPEHVCGAHIARTFKKKDTEYLRYYHPISLLNVIYKKYAAAIQKDWKTRSTLSFKTLYMASESTDRQHKRYTSAEGCWIVDKLDINI